MLRYGGGDDGAEYIIIIIRKIENTRRVKLISKPLIRKSVGYPMYGK